MRMALVARARTIASAAAFALPALLLGGSGCSNPGQFTWITALPPQPPSDADYVVREGDQLDIRVFAQEALATHARVRTDGRIAMPFVGDVEVRGKKPAAIRAELEARLKDYINTPSVTVNVPEIQPITIVVLGEVGHPGVFPVAPHATVAQVLALAGGLTDFAGRDSIFVVRQNPQLERVRFTYEGLSRGEPHAAAFALRDGDLIVAE
jgi:polysaccharide biosynthesis/export protein